MGPLRNIHGKPWPAGHPSIHVPRKARLSGSGVRQMLTYWGQASGLSCARFLTLRHFWSKNHLWAFLPCEVFIVDSMFQRARGTKSKVKEFMFCLDRLMDWHKTTHNTFLLLPNVQNLVSLLHHPLGVVAVFSGLLRTSFGGPGSQCGFFVVSLNSTLISSYPTYFKIHFLFIF